MLNKLDYLLRTFIKQIQIKSVYKQQIALFMNLSQTSNMEMNK